MNRLFFFLLFVSLASPCFSQTITPVKMDTSRVAKEPVTNEEKSARFARRLGSELKLKSDQIEQVRIARLDFMNAKDALNRKYPDHDSRTKNQAEFDKVDEKFNASMKVILTPEQFTTWEQKKKERMESQPGSGAPLKR